ncbi:MAG: thioredoxin family protein [bacterium]|nr:thioredoxin family protein [bacterium]
MRQDDNLIDGNQLIARRSAGIARAGRMRVFARTIMALAVTALTAGTWPLAAQVPANAPLKDFEPNGEFLFELDGRELEHAEVFFSERAVAYLILAPELASPLLVNPRTSSVVSVHLMKVARREGGTIDLLADATLDPVSQFEVKNHEVVFTLSGKTAKLKPRPPLLGRQSAQGLKDYDPQYARKAARYRPTSKYLETLKAQRKQVRVLVYFGTWCSTCKRVVPSTMKVADELRGSRIDFEYYGLVSPLTDDPEAKRLGIHGVPTAVVFVSGEEAGRLTGSQLVSPEAALSRLLGSS